MGHNDVRGTLRGLHAVGSPSPVSGSVADARLAGRGGVVGHLYNGLCLELVRLIAQRRGDGRGYGDHIVFPAGGTGRMRGRGRRGECGEGGCSMSVKRRT